MTKLIGLIPTVERLRPPLSCVACGVIAQFSVDGTSICWRHYSQQYQFAAARRREEATDA